MALFQKGNTPHNRKSAESPAPETPPAAQTAQEQLAALLAEQAAIERELADHREQRQRWLADGGDLDRITRLGSEDERLQLRSEQLNALLPALRDAAERERAAQHAARWLGLAPDLEAAMQDTATAIRAYDEASVRYRRLHWNAAQSGFAAELSAEFVSPPGVPHNPWVFETFVKAVAQCPRQRAVARAMAAQAPLPVPGLDPGIDIAELFEGPIERFKPKRVDPREVVRISAIAPPRRVRILHGPVRTANLNIGIARVFPGELHNMPPRAAYALVASGCAEYANDEPATAA